MDKIVVVDRNQITVEDKKKLEDLGYVIIEPTAGSRIEFLAFSDPK